MATDKSKILKLHQELRAGDRRALAKAITLIESHRADQRGEADALLELLMPATGQSIRLGVSGAPGVGKSTFIEAFGQLLLKDPSIKLAILAIDPTSPLSGGSILGDRTRMEVLSRDERVFIRPTPAGSTLGGVARRTREAILACEAAGYNFILVETVGVGQSETLVQAMVDLFLILQQPHAGDELQGIKRGILELADLVVVTKADGVHKPAADLAKGQLEQALMFARGSDGEMPPVLTVSSTEMRGFDALHAAIEKLIKNRKERGLWLQQRDSQMVQWFHTELGELLRESLKQNPSYAAQLTKKEQQVLAGQLPASLAARQVINSILGA